MSEARIYVASRTHHAAVWKTYRLSGAPIISSWIDEAGAGETKDWGDLWNRCRDEIRSATGFLFYAKASDVPLKGAFVELGIALDVGVPIVAVAPDEVLGNLAKHPLIHRDEWLGEAMKKLSGPWFRASKPNPKPRSRSQAVGGSVIHLSVKQHVAGDEK